MVLIIIVGSPYLSHTYKNIKDYKKNNNTQTLRVRRSQMVINKCQNIVGTKMRTRLKKIKR